MSKDNGGPAFPAPEASVARFGIGNEDAFMGATLRDYFAAKAMQAMVANDWPMHSVESTDHLTSSAYGLADAMLAERAK